MIVLVLFDTDLENVVPHIMPITIKKGNRDEIRHKLLDYGIETGIHYKPNHLLSYFKPKRRRSFNVSDLLWLAKLKECYYYRL